MPEAAAPGLAEIEAAAGRIAGRVRRTPLLAATALREPAGAERLSLKLECLQVTGSFKARGAMSTLTALPPEELARGLVTASGGNHGLGVAYAGWAAGVPATIFLPRSTPEAKAEQIRAWGADVHWHGEVWDQANEAALAHAGTSGQTYVHAFADPRVIAGQGTCGLEILEQDPEVDLLVVAIGGGGLISGIATAVKARRPDVRIVGVEPVGAPTLRRSLDAGDLVTLPAIETRAGTLAPRRSARINYDLIARHVDDIVLVDDAAMAEAAGWLWRELGIGAELSGAASVAALRSGALAVAPDTNVCALVCGAGGDGMSAA